MKRLVVATCLVLSSGPAYGEWIKVAVGAASGVTVYADPATIRRKGDLVKIWELCDFTTAQFAGGVSYLSKKTQSEYDCAEERWRQLAVTVFSGHMGHGEVVFTDADIGKWTTVLPGSVGQVEWTLACKKP